MDRSLPCFQEKGSAFRWVRVRTEYGLKRYLDAGDTAFLVLCGPILILENARKLIKFLYCSRVARIDKA